MATRRQFDHIGSAKFMVEISGITAGTFSAVEGIEAKVDVVTFANGDDALVRKRPGRTSYSNIVLKRGIVNNAELWKWFKATVDGAVQRQDGSLIVFDESRQEIFRYNFSGAWPCRWKSLVMQADTSGTLVEELEIVVEKIERA